jgi:hypothetical protein
MIPEKTTIVKNFLASKEIQTILEDLDKNYSLAPDKNHYLPYPFPSIDWSKAEMYKEKTARFVNSFSKDLVSILQYRLNNLFKPSQFNPIQSISPEFQFNPFTLRILRPSKVDIHHHVENQSVEQYANFFQELGYYLQVYNQFSFVLMVQAPEQGGEIVLFDEVWKGHHLVEQQRKALDDMDTADAIAHKIKEVICLNAGDLLIFPAGITWHKVAEVSGNIERITLGGFIGKSLTEENSYLFWS